MTTAFQRIKGLPRILAVVIFLTVTLMPPATVLFVGWHDLDHALDNEARTLALIATRSVGRFPEVWIYTPERMQFALHHALAPQRSLRFVLPGGKVFVELGTRPPEPQITSGCDVFDRDQVVGRLEVTASMRPLYRGAGLAAACSLAAACALTLPLNALVLRRMRQAALDLEKSEKRYRLMAEHAEDVIWVLDEIFRFTFVSPSMARMYGGTVQELLGSSVLDLVPPAAREQAWNAIKGYQEVQARGENPPFLLESEFMRKDGTTGWVEVRMRRFLDDEGRPQGYAGVTREVTLRHQALEQLRAAKEEAERANLAKSAFLANMSHEIRTPLNGLMGMLQLLEPDQANPDQAEYVMMAREAAGRLLRLLNDILDLSRLDAGKLAVVSEPFDPSAALAEAVAMFALTAQAKGIALTADVDANVPRAVLGDRARVMQILLNLIGNAVKFTAQGRVDVALCALFPDVSPPRTMLLFCVSDTGPGIPDSVLPRLFTPFIQADNSLTREHQGAGLGLVIVKRLAALMNGSVSVESEEGRGTAFYVMVRVEPCEDEEEAPPDEGAGESNGRPGQPEGSQGLSS